MAEIACNLLGAAFLLPLGLALGSFLELAVERIRRRESLVWPPSHCRTCGTRLTVTELVPVFSYLLQRGRCRSCGTPIGRGVPVREALSGVALALPWAVAGCGHTLLSLASGLAVLVAGWLIWALRQDNH